MGWAWNESLQCCQPRDAHPLAVSAPLASAGVPGNDGGQARAQNNHAVWDAEEKSQGSRGKGTKTHLNSPCGEGEAAGAEATNSVTPRVPIAGQRVGNVLQHETHQRHKTVWLPQEGRPAGCAQIHRYGLPAYEAEPGQQRTPLPATRPPKDSTLYIGSSVKFKTFALQKTPLSKLTTGWDKISKTYTHQKKVLRGAWVVQVG